MTDTTQAILDKANPGMLTVRELWYDMRLLTKNIVANNDTGSYPKELRATQILTLQTILAELETHHRGGKHEP